MPIYPTQVTSANASSTGTTSINVTPIVTYNNFMFFWLYKQSAVTSTSVTDTNANLWSKQSHVDTVYGYELWTAFSKAAGTPTITANLSGSTRAVMFFGAYLNANTVSGLVYDTGYGTGTLVSKTCTSGMQDAFYITCLGLSSNTETITNPTAGGTWTQRQSTGNAHGRYCDRVASTPQTPNYSLSGPDQWVVVTFAIQNVICPLQGIVI